VKTNDNLSAGFSIKLFVRNNLNIVGCAESLNNNMIKMGIFSMELNTNIDNEPISGQLQFFEDINGGW
jgi:hypothetical protein